MTLPTLREDHEADTVSQDVDTDSRVSTAVARDLVLSHKIYLALAIVLVVAAGVAMASSGEIINVVGAMGWNGWLPG